MRWYKIVCDIRRTGINWVGVYYFTAVSCEDAKIFLLSHIPDAMKIAVRPHHGERTW